MSHQSLHNQSDVHTVSSMKGLNKNDSKSKKSKVTIRTGSAENLTNLKGLDTKPKIEASKNTIPVTTQPKIDVVDQQEMTATNNQNANMRLLNESKSASQLGTGLNFRPDLTEYPNDHFFII